MFSRDSPLLLGVLRAVQALFAIIVLGTAGFVASWWTSAAGWPYLGSAPSSVSFLVFCGAWTLLVVVYMIVVPWLFPNSIPGHIIIITAIEAVTMIFWFAGFIALAVFLNDRDCVGNVCHSAQAAAVFGAFDWVLFCVTLGLATWSLMRDGRRGKSYGQRNGAPSMSVNQGV